MDDHVDVLIVGAGLSGIGAACHLETELPGKRYAILEARETIGGTWDLFRYPGIRSDSDMQTLGYRFRPWTQDDVLADGPSILAYVRETAREYGVDEHIRFGHQVQHASWSTADGRWTVDVALAGTGETTRLTCDFLLGCGGYYRYDQGYTPEFPGLERFGGEVVHPQHWPEDLDYAGKRVVVIGSGATAVTLVPAMTEEAGHVTMLQRSPTYIVAIPGRDVVAAGLRRVLGDRGYAVTRWKNVAMQWVGYRMSRRFPKVVRAGIRAGLKSQLPDGYDIDRHFKPRYQPWDQRMCVVPDGDLFKAIRRKQASVVTDRIAAFTETGIALESGEHLDADLVVTATGLDLQAYGGLDLTVDGEAVDLPERMVYKGMMISGVPNAAFCFGYTNASWTLKADLTSEYVCRLLAYMDQRGLRQCVPIPAPSVVPRRLLDFDAGYVKRAEHLFPKQGSEGPWKLPMNYATDVVTIRRRPIADGVLRFDAGAPATAGAATRTPVAA